MSPTQPHAPPRRAPLVAFLFLAFAALAPARADQAPAVPADTHDWTRDDAAHLLRRAGFGGTPEQVHKLHVLGKRDAVEYLLIGQWPKGASVTPPFEPASLPDFHFSGLTADSPE